MSMETKTIKGQAWITSTEIQNAETNEKTYKYSLVQDQILVVAGKDSYSNVVTLIDDIWADLTSETGTYKTNGKGYFYWEVEMTDIEDDDKTVTIHFECPKPYDDVFTEPYDPDAVSGDYAKYWVGKLKTATDNYKYRTTIQKKEIIFPGTSYISPVTGTPVVVPETKEKNTDLGDITNLLGLF